MVDCAALALALPCTWPASSMMTGSYVHCLQVAAYRLARTFYVPHVPARSQHPSCSLWRDTKHLTDSYTAANHQKKARPTPSILHTYTQSRVSAC